MKKQVSTFLLLGVVIGAPSFAQESFDVQAAMEEVRQENLQRIGVKRQQEIISIMRKRAEDMAAIEAAGYVITDDGQLRKRSGSDALANRPQLMSANPPTDSSGSTSGLFSDGESESALAGMPGEDDQATNEAGAASEFNSRPFQLKGVLSNSAIFAFGNSNARYAVGDTLPGGFVLKKINQDSVQVAAPDGGKQTLYMDWSAVSNLRVNGDGDENGSRVYMQSGVGGASSNGGLF